MKAFSRLIRFLRRSSPKLEYAAVKEEGSRSGMQHLHVLLLNFNFTPQAQISREWRHLTGAWVVDVQRVEGSRAQAYCAKYVSKQLDSTRKNVTYSKGWPPLPPFARTAIAIDELDYFGPSKWLGVTDQHGLMALLKPDCSCFGTMHETTLGEVLWLKSLKGRSPPLYRAG